MLLAIVGSVKFRSYELAFGAESLIYGTIYRYLNAIENIISGGADGVDTMGESIGKHFGFNNPIIHLPKNRRWKPEGFEERNLKIVNDCTHLLCIRDSTSKTYGSGWTSDRAKEMGRVVWRYDL